MIRPRADHDPAEGPVIETLDLGPESAIGQGYGESKWVAEQVLGCTTRETGLKTTVVRVGQLSGDTRVGGWSTSEWVPAMVRAGQGLGSIPNAEGVSYSHTFLIARSTVLNALQTVSWVPVDAAASVLLEMVNSTEQVLHLTSPRPVSWSTLFTSVTEQLGVPLIPASEWLAKLGQSAQEASTGTSVSAGTTPHTACFASSRESCRGRRFASICRQL